MFEFNFDTAGKMSADKLHDLIILKSAELKKGLEKYKNQNPNEKYMNYENIEKQINNFSSAINVVISMQVLNLKDYHLKYIYNLINCSNKYNMPLNIYVSGGSRFGNRGRVEALFNSNDLKQIEQLNQILKDNGKNEIRFMEDVTEPDKAWTLEQVKTANSKIDEVVKTIKEKKLTPFEAAAFIHSIATKFQYKENDENPLISRSLVGVTNTDYIVCVGYSTFVKAVIDKLQMRGLECEKFSSTLIDNFPDEESDGEEKLPGIGAGHMQALIRINDPKYKVKGVYISDACFDCKDSDYPNGKGYANFMFPVTDLLCYKDMTFNQPTDIFSLIDQITGESVAKDPTKLPVIKENARHSKPISLSSIKLVLINLYKKIYPNYYEDKIIKYVDMIIEASIEHSKNVFTSSAKNAISIEANRDVPQLER